MRKAKHLFLLICFLFTAFLVAAQDRVSIASFNLQIFGQSKVSKVDVLGEIASIIRQFDLVAIQEIRNKDETAILTLMNAVNAEGREYSFIVGPRLGRTNSKEQYAYIYRESVFKSVGEPTTWLDDGDLFEREPFLCKFQTVEGNLDFVLVNIHTKPEDAGTEIGLLSNVMAYASQTYEEPDVLCLGDWNADGSYYDEAEYSVLFPMDQYIWIIPNDADTTVAEKSNAYDRMAGTMTMKEDWTGDWGVLRFDQFPSVAVKGLKPKDISDHFPIWAVLYTTKDTD